MKQVKVKLKDNTIVIGDEFDMEDYKKFKQIFRKWTDINSDLKQFGGRNLNVPDVFSEALYCIFFNAVRTNGTAHSYDAVDKETGEGIQIKSASIQNDCTSFGPTSTWDKLIFADLAPNGSVDGNVWFYAPLFFQFGAIGRLFLRFVSQKPTTRFYYFRSYGRADSSRVYRQYDVGRSPYDGSFISER